MVVIIMVKTAIMDKIDIMAIITIITISAIMITIWVSKEPPGPQEYSPALQKSPKILYQIKEQKEKK